MFYQLQGQIKNAKRIENEMTTWKMSHHMQTDRSYTTDTEPTRLTI